MAYDKYSIEGRVNQDGSIDRDYIKGLLIVLSPFLVLMLFVLCLIIGYSMCDNQDSTGQPMTAYMNTVSDKSYSMYPALDHSGMYEFEFMPEDERPLAGHVYAYELGNKTIIHRLIYETEQGQYIFKGDNNAYPDPGYVNRSQITQKVTGVWYR